MTIVRANPDASTKELRSAIESHLQFTVGKDAKAATLSDWRIALTAAIRDLVVAPWFETTRRIYEDDRKRVYYLSMEFLIGRLLEDAVANLGLEEVASEAMSALGQDYRAVVTNEPDAALGNGGLGRLAACFLDSMSTIGVPAYGYGIRYEHGLFRQRFVNGWQVEEAEDWLRQTHPWEFERRETAYHIGFGGSVVSNSGDAADWLPEETVLAQGYDTPIPGWKARWTNTLRLWSAKPEKLFDLGAFNRGDYVGAVEPAVDAETISRVLYPDDTTERGKELRLKQEYFFSAASIQDLLRRFLAREKDVTKLPAKVAIQLNDTHPAIAVAELVRLLVDRHDRSFDDALGLAQGTLNYTNHTLMPEALEKWPYDLMARVLPRHVEIIERIDEHHARSHPERPESTRIIDHGEIRMGNLAFIGAHRVNGVSALHTGLMQQTVFRDLHALHPDKITNETNGVTPRRWIHTCNPGLRDLFDETVGDGWVTDLDALEALAPFADDAGFRERFAAVKHRNKVRLAEHLRRRTGVEVDPSAMFDIQIKRIHEYKRQLMNILEAAALWNAIRRDPHGDWTPRVKIFGGKAAPGYAQAKLIIKLINDIAETVNSDPVTEGLLRIVYPPDYNVTLAERLIPAADLSEQISTAGMEASGTGNMKFAMNGALTVGTLDGANVEIREAVGPENIFIFGLTADEVAALRAENYRPSDAIADSRALSEVIDQIEAGVFSPDAPDRFAPLVDNLRNHDWFLVTADFDAYFACQREIDRAWADRDTWNRKAILNSARMGRFSSDRTIRGYARDIWDVEPSW